MDDHVKASRTLMGAWIETMIRRMWRQRGRSHPYGCVD